MQDITTDYYHKNSQSLCKKYESVSFESVHKGWMEYLPTMKGHVLDVGAGSGRDAAWLSHQGFTVTAVEPVDQFIIAAEKLHSGLEIEWINDTLPQLSKLTRRYGEFSLILLSAVWMHIKLDERNTAFAALSDLNSADGLLVITLRHGLSQDERKMYPVAVKELESLGKKYNYNLKAVDTSSDQLNRNDVYWQTVVLEKNH